MTACGAENHFTHHPSEKVFTNLQDRQQVRSFYDSLTRGSKFHSISYASHPCKVGINPIAAAKAESEEKVYAALQRILKAEEIPMDDEWLLIHSYVFRVGATNQETDFILISKNRGIIIVESKGTDVNTEKSCPKAAVFSGWAQIRSASEAIRAILLEDLNLVGSNYGVTEAMIEAMCAQIDWQSFVTLPKATEMNLLPCGKCEDKGAPADPSRPNVSCKDSLQEWNIYVLGESEKQFESNLEVTLHSRLIGPVGNTDTATTNNNLFDFLLRRFVGLKHLCRLCVLNPTAIANHQFNMDHKMTAINEEVARAAAKSSVEEVMAQKNSKLFFLTEDQIKILLRGSNDHRYISGPAGSGKTVLMLAKIQQLMEDFFSGEAPLAEYRILVVNFSKPVTTWIKQVLQAKLDELLGDQCSNSWKVEYTELESFVDVTQAGQFASGYLGWDPVVTKSEIRDRIGNESVNCSPLSRESQLRRDTVFSKMANKYTHIFVDEAQSFWVSKSYPHWLDDHKRMAKSHQSGCFWILFDLSQWPKANPFEANWTRLNSLTSDKLTHIPLTKIFRSTNNLKKFAQSFVGSLSQFTLSHHYEGPKIQLLGPFHVSEIDQYVKDKWAVERPTVPMTETLEVATDLLQFVKSYWETNISKAADIVSGIIEQIGQSNMATTASSATSLDIAVLVQGCSIGISSGALKEELQRGNKQSGRNPIDVVDVKSVGSEPDCKQGQSGTIRIGGEADFTGLDAHTVVLFSQFRSVHAVQLLAESLPEEDFSLFYNGVSRATTYLFIVSTDEMEKLIRRKCSESNFANCVASEDDFDKVNQRSGKTKKKNTP